MDIEVDGKWGPYLECNPVNVSEPNGNWICDDKVAHNNPPGYSDECSQWWGYQDYTIQASPKKVLLGVDMGECCVQATPNNP
jgi:hypothetical protein